MLHDFFNKSNQIILDPIGNNASVNYNYGVRLIIILTYSTNITNAKLVCV